MSTTTTRAAVVIREALATASTPEAREALALALVRAAVAEAEVRGVDARDVRAAVTSGEGLGGLRRKESREVSASTSCQTCGEDVRDEARTHALHFALASSSSAQGAKYVAVCGNCIDALLERGEGGEVPVVRRGEHDGVRVTLSVYCPSKPWDTMGTPNLHGVMYTMGALPSWGVGHRGCKWSVTFEGMRWHGYLISLYNTGYNPMVYLTVEGPKGTVRESGRYGSKAALWSAVKRLRAAVK